MKGMSETLTAIMENDINLTKMESILQDNFNVIRTTASEIFIKPERKENKDNLIKRIKEIISENINLDINPDIYVTIYKSASEIVVRIKRIKRNSR